MFLCLDIRPSQDTYVYYIGTEFESFLNDALYGTINSTVTTAEVCNRAEPLDGSSAVMLVKNTSSIQGIPCPPSTFFTYNSLSFVDGINIKRCPLSRLDVCEDSTRMRFDINSTCGTAIATSADFSCLYYVDSGNTTYLYMETDDRNMMSLQHNIVCVEIENVQEGIILKMYPEYCNDLMTAHPILSLQLTSTEKCQGDFTVAATTRAPLSTPSSGDRSFTVYFVIGGVVVLCIATAVIIATAISRQKMCFQCRLQPQLPENGQQFTDLNN
ncbi:hypothetical protein KP79_PYT12804 [Mizuhopecten yessoensis]|uniref:Uncharacterized protein n=2 Tax=Mizuhopecten yessoensis TaxID=6573 RepID=A0A210PNJ0_MIZYE|nr:hypothetical protein KP79_PYT12804 [Mizuhopecten yessoensis]